MRFLIIGGSDAGISAALRARELAPEVEVTVVLADEFPNFSICGLPFFRSGEAPNWHQLAHRTEFDGIELLTNCIARRILLKVQSVEVLDRLRETTRHLSYDRLLIATGARPSLPAIAGLDLDGVYQLHTMEDSFRIHDRLSRGAASAVLVGSGYIGLEMADALVNRRMKVTLIGRSISVLPSADQDFGQIIEGQLKDRGVFVQSATNAVSIERSGTKLRVRGERDLAVEADLVLIAAGVTPNSQLAHDAGLELGSNGAIRVNRKMEASHPNVYAAGDCAETWHRLLENNTYLPLGTTSHKQGRVAGENAVGGERQFAGSVGTQVVKVFDLAIARTGLRESEARKAGLTPTTSVTASFDHKAYYPGAREIWTKITGESSTGRLLGAQMMGHWQTSIAKRIDVFATALFHKMGVEDLNDLDLCYTPPLGSPWDAVQTAGQAWSARRKSLSSAKG